MSKKDLTVITAITDGKDELKPQPRYAGVEYVAYVDRKTQVAGWKTRKACDKFVEPRMNARIHKILAHKYADTPYLVWMDGNMMLKQDPHALVTLMGKHDFAFFKHPTRDCLFGEAQVCASVRKGRFSDLAEQFEAYARRAFPGHAGLCETTGFVRKNTPSVNVLFERWWAEITRYSNRDQISFPVVFAGQKWATIPGSVRYRQDDPRFPGNEYFAHGRHQQ